MMNFNLNITDIDHEKQTLKLHGTKVTHGYFIGVILPSLLAGRKSVDEDVIDLAIELHRADFNVQSFLPSQLIAQAQYKLDQQAEARRRQEAAQRRFEAEQAEAAKHPNETVQQKKDRLVKEHFAKRGALIPTGKGMF